MKSGMEGVGWRVAEPTNRMDARSGGNLSKRPSAPGVCEFYWSASANGSFHNTQ
jgi:hypothetical protein